ncbi:hypothetical protein FB567DRAFT_543039 [Paraphoma chrysanthemicola]|uniref:Uncharacterized protein n=1 Tax=Paraphoma chrysanthemicola TaxID=798071 RepID=A0A8K0RHI3_9PLEO|nr:hypothetical protein FB567DRAFT_543039 [Paraphoma chrysanthemicola]
MPIPSLLFRVLASSLALAHASPIPPTPTSASSHWSKEEVLGLASVLVAVCGIIVALLIAFPKFRKSLYGPCRSTSLTPMCLIFGCMSDASQDCVMRQQEKSRDRMRKKYEDFVRFQEYVRLSEGRNEP